MLYFGEKAKAYLFMELKKKVRIKCTLSPIKTVWRITKLRITTSSHIGVIRAMPSKTVGGVSDDKIKLLNV